MTTPSDSQLAFDYIICGGGSAGCVLANRLSENGRYQVIDPNYLTTDDDRLVAAESIRKARQIMEADALKPYQPSEHLPGTQYQSDDDLAKLAGDIATTIFHPVGTARMGIASDRRAVVDGTLKVHGIEGLRVADASVMPTITSGNTNSPTIMIAEKASEFIRSSEQESRSA